MSKWLKEISVQKADNIASLRSGTCTAKIINSLFDNLTKQYQVSGITEASHIWNTDETGFNSNQGKKGLNQRIALKSFLQKQNQTHVKINKQTKNLKNLTPHVLQKNMQL